MVKKLVSKLYKETTEHVYIENMILDEKVENIIDWLRNDNIDF